VQWCIGDIAEEASGLGKDSPKSGGTRKFTAGTVLNYVALLGFALALCYQLGGVLDIQHRG
jgi:hypothetical protein